MTPEQARAIYRRQMALRGEAVTLRRVVPNASSIDATVPAKVAGYAPEELVGGIQQGDRKVLILAEDVEASGFPLPIRKAGADKIVVRGAVLTIQTVDDSTCRLGETLVAYIIRATG